MAQSDFKVELTNLREVKDYIETMPKESFPAAKEMFRKSVISAANVVKQMKRLKKRSGMLKKSIQESVTGSNFDTLRASIYSAQGAGSKEVLYAPVHEFGTGNEPIKPKKAYKKVRGGPYLNIPVGANLTLGGSMRKSAKTVFKEGGKLGGKDGFGVYLKGVKMFLLTKGPIHLKPKLGMRDAAEAEIPTLLSNLADVIGAEN